MPTRRLTRKKRVVIVGSTGSIGQNALDVIRRLRHKFEVVGLAANKNVKAMIGQIKSFSPRFVAMGQLESSEELKELILRNNLKTTVLNHGDGLESLARLPKSDFVLFGTVGAAGLKPLIAALKAGKTIGLANKEALVIAGDIITRLSRKYRAAVIPVDSEHSAIFQCLKGHQHGKIARLILTASGGPFYKSNIDLRKITVDQALKHPTWKMGNKITIDSASLMNKGLEAIEAHHLFEVPMDRISVLIHPQSIIHSLVEFEDGSLLAQLSHPDMRLPIQYALTYPSRYPSPVRALDLASVGRLDFQEPNFDRFPCLKLAFEAGKKGGTAPAALSAANEIAVHAFINGEIGFMDIPQIVKKVMVKHRWKMNPSLKDILDVDAWAREESRNFISNGLIKKGAL